MFIVKIMLKLTTTDLTKIQDFTVEVGKEKWRRHEKAKFLSSVVNC